jgi:hypothetical protein
MGDSGDNNGETLPRRSRRPGSIGLVDIRASITTIRKEAVPAPDGHTDPSELPSDLEGRDSGTKGTEKS